MLVLALLACSEEYRAYPEENLLALAEVSVEEEGHSRDDLEITGSVDDGWLVVASDETLTLSSPAKSDLGRLDGTYANLHLEADEDGVGSSVIALDARGIDGADSVPYLYDEAAGSEFTKGAFGADFVTFGGVTGTADVDGNPVFVRTAVFQTDEGELEASPGQPVRALIDGKTYRLTLLAAWSLDSAPEVAEALDAGCDNFGARLAFEMLLDPDFAGEADAVEREEGGSLAEPAACD